MIEIRERPAAGHTIRAEFPLEISRGEDWERQEEGFAPGEVRGSGELNGGGEVLRLRALAGDIEILKLTPQVVEQLRQRQESSWKRWLERWQRQLEKRQRKQEREAPQ